MKLILDEALQPSESSRDATDQDAGPDHWHISLRFHEDSLRNGLEPLVFLQYLSTLGNIHRLVCLTASVPDIATIDPESCYLGYELSFYSHVTQETIESTFDFIREASFVRVLPPGSPRRDYRALIEEVPEPFDTMVRVLTDCGTLADETSAPRDAG